MKRKSWVTSFAKEALRRAYTFADETRDLPPSTTLPYQPASDADSSEFDSGNPEQGKGFVRTSGEEKVVCKIVIRHPEHPKLVLFGLRRDDQAWCTPGGHAEPGEDPVQAMLREFAEECGLTLPSASLVHTVKVPEKNLLVCIFEGPTAEPGFWLSLDASGDPDSEFVCYQFINPLDTDLPLHIPLEYNAVAEYLEGEPKTAYVNSLRDLTTAEETLPGALTPLEDTKTKDSQTKTSSEAPYSSGGMSPADEVLEDNTLIQQHANENSKGLGVREENERADFEQLKDFSVRVPL